MCFIFLSSYADCCNLFQTTYKVTALATAEEYHLESLAGEVKKYGYSVVQLPEGILLLMTCMFMLLVGFHRLLLNVNLTAVYLTFTSTCDSYD